LFVPTLSSKKDLAQNGYMKDAAFVNYLKYLLYWKKPEYAKFIVYAVLDVVLLVRRC